MPSLVIALVAMYYRKFGCFFSCHINYNKSQVCSYYGLHTLDSVSDIFSIISANICFFQPQFLFFPTQYLFFQPQSSFSSFYFSLSTVPRRAKPLCHVPPPFVRSSRRCLSPLPKRFLHNLHLNACFPAPLLLLILPHAVHSPPHALCQPPQDKSQSCENPWPLVSLCVSGKHR